MDIRHLGNTLGSFPKMCCNNNQHTSQAALLHLHNGTEYVITLQHTINNGYKGE